MKKVKRPKPKVTGTCYACASAAKTLHECVTCERLQKTKPEHAIYSVATCRYHAAGALEEIKKHVLVAHPSNLLGAIGAALKGEDVW